MASARIPSDQSQRDFLMVRTISGQVKTLRIRDILRFHSGPYQHTTTVQFNNGMPALVVQETCPAFQQRCDGLLLALQTGDVCSIEEHFVPRPGPASHR